MPDYGEMKVEELRHLATERKISGRAEMNKAELVASLDADDADSDRIGLLERRVSELEARLASILLADPIQKVR
jgi:hypothetical protein